MSIQKPGLRVSGRMKAKPTLIHLIQSLDSGGCENMLLRTLPRMDQFHHVVITLSRPGELAERFRKQGISVVSVGLRHLVDASGLLRLLREVNINKPVLVITYLFHADMIGRLLLQPLVRAPIIPFLRTTYNDPAYKVARLSERVTKWLVRGYFANSEAVKDFYRRDVGVPPHKIKVIPNGLDLTLFDTSHRNSKREELGIPVTDLVIICVANFAPNKGHRYLLEAYELFFTGHPNSRLILVGQGHEEDSLKGQVNQYASRHNILFLGRRYDVPSLLIAADIFALPTFFEGMSNAIMEAMAAGVAIVTTDIPENRAILQEGKTGLLIPTGDIQSIYEALNDLAKDATLRKRLGAAAKKVIEEDFSLPVVVKLWSESIKGIIK